MSTLIQLEPGGDWVSAGDVRSIVAGMSYVLVRMHDDAEYRIRCAMLADLGPTRDALAAKVNAALAPQPRINTEGYATAPTARWHYPVAGEPAPKGAIVQLLTAGGTQVQGIWRDSGAYIAWAPNLKRDRALEKQYFNINNEGAPE